MCYNGDELVCPNCGRQGLYSDGGYEYYCPLCGCEVSLTEEG